MPQGQERQASPQVPALQRLELRDVTHQYYHEQSDDFFELGPINLSFTPGEVVFLVGTTVAVRPRWPKSWWGFTRRKVARYCSMASGSKRMAGMPTGSSSRWCSQTSISLGAC